MSDDINTLRDHNRRLAAEVADLRRDYADLCALDPDGLRAKVVALQTEVADRDKYVAQLRASLEEELGRSSAYYQRATLAEFAASPAVVASEIAEAKRAASTMGDYLRMANADVERLAGASVAEVLKDRRQEIRDLTRRLNDALAAQERTAAEFRQWQRTTTFAIDPSQAEAERAFKADHDARHAGEDQGSIGGAFVYSFCDTSIGHVVSLRCACGEKIDLTGDL